MSTSSRLLLVDDDPDVVWSLGRFLVREGHLVTTCGDGIEAIPLIEQNTFDVLITDIQMPQLNGLALIEWVRQNHPEIQVVVMTAFGSPSVHQICLHRGAIMYLEKPIDPELLVEVLGSACGTGEGITGNVCQIDLFDYIQLMMVTRRQILVEVSSSDGRRGQIFLQDGQALHAKCGDLEGEDAFFSCLAFDNGSFSAIPLRQAPDITIQKRGEYLLIEAARRKDEANKAQSLVEEKLVCSREGETDRTKETIACRPSSTREETDNPEAVVPERTLQSSSGGEPHVANR